MSADLITAGMQFISVEFLNDTVEFEFTITNQGSSTAAASTAAIYDLTSAASLGSVLATVAIPSISGVDSYTSFVSVPLAANFIGTFYFTAVADYNDAISESNYANNASTPVPLMIDTTSVAGSGPGTLLGTSGNDIILALNVNGDIINGGAGSDQINGLGNDTVELWNHSSGTSYDNTIDIFFGSINTLDYSRSPGSVIVNFQTGIASDYYGGSDSFSNIQKVIGSNHGDTFIVSPSGGETMIGGSGNNTFELSGGNNYVYGGSGSDNTLNYSFATSALDISLTAGTTTYESSGNLDHFSNIQNIIGSPEGMTISGGAGGYTLTGLSGGINVFGLTGGSNTIQGGGGDNRLNYSGATGAVNVNLATGITTYATGGTDHFSDIQDVMGSPFNDVLTAGTAAAVFTTDGGSDTLTGGPGDDTFYINGDGPGTVDNDFINGGGGFNTLDYYEEPGPINVNMQNGTTSKFYGGTDHFSNIQEILGTLYNDTFISALTGNEYFVSGGDGNDTFYLSGGGNSAIGQLGGFNTLNYENAASAVTVNVAGGTTSYASGGSDDTFVDISQFDGSAFNDTLTAAGVLTGVAFNGAAGNNTMTGGSGNDTFELWSDGPGTDYSNFINGGGGYNTLDYSQAPGPVNVNMATGTTSNYYGGTDHFSNIQQVNGSPFNDMLTAGSAGAVFNGGGGSDTMMGGAGNDTFQLWSDGPGTDNTNYINGGGGTNTLDYSKSPGPVNVNMMTGTTSNYYGGTDYFSNIQDVVGSAFNDVLIANGSGSVLTGGSGNDTFEFVEGHTNGATVTDFTSGTDSLLFTGFGTSGATFVQDSFTQWTVNSANGADHETITFANSAPIKPSDFSFT